MHCKSLRRIAAILALGLFPCAELQADQFHYRNLIIGDRAMGLGGAYGAVADDASGVFYNPGGLGFALSNDVTGSANALYNRETVYKKALGNRDFSENSSGTTPSFFGILQKLDNISKGLVFALGLYTTDSELKDQDDLVENVAVETRNKNSSGQEVTSKLQVYRWHRTINARGSTFYAGAALAKRIASNFSVGLGINFVTIDELVQEYQDTRTGAFPPQTSASAFIGHQAQNIRQHLKAVGVQPVLGIQYAFGGRFSLGMTFKAGSYLSNSLDQSFERMQPGIPADVSGDLANGSTAVAEDGTPSTVGVTYSQTNLTATQDDALGTMPMEARLAFAAFLSVRSLFTFDVTWHQAVTDAFEPYNKEQVLNYAGGLEYYVFPSFPIRLGMFTNSDARGEIDKKKAGQRDHIDFIGLSTFFAWVQPNSQIAVGTIFQQGAGESQKIGDLQVQDVEAQSFTFAFSISQSI